MLESILQPFSLTPLDAGMIAVCALLFLLLWTVLDKVLFTPYLKLIEVREGATSGAVETSQERQNQAQSINDEYDSALMNARVEAMKKKLAVLDKAKQDAQQLVDKATDEAKAELKAAKDDIAKSADTLRNRVLSDADSMAAELARKLKEPKKYSGSSLA